MCRAPSSTARRATAMAVPGSVAGPFRRPGNCIAPKPSRETVTVPPSANVPAVGLAEGEVIERSMASRPASHQLICDKVEPQPQRAGEAGAHLGLLPLKDSFPALAVLAWPGLGLRVQNSQR